MRIPVAVLRLVVAAAALCAIVATFAGSAAQGPVNPFNFFGFFTIQGNIIATVLLAVAAVVGLRGREQSLALQLARGCATTYIVLVGIVYNTLLTGLAGGVVVPWANTVLHLALPLYAAVDWILIGDRAPLPWRRYWIVLVYPLVWTAVVLVRGATDGWVPYPFLDPSLGYGVVAAYAVAIAAGFALVGLGVWAISRRRPVLA
jgi:hypothetical protein